MIHLTWTEIMAATWELAQRLRTKGFRYVYGIPTGGAIVASLLYKHGFQPVDISGNWRHKEVAIVDDLVDSGRTMRPYRDEGFYCDALYRKDRSPADLAPSARNAGDDWIHFPWEHTTGAEDAVARLLEHIGEDPNREGLLDTPERVTRALRDMCEGYGQDPHEILKKRFKADYDEMVIETNIEFTSLCEHHLLPFTGSCAVGYIPDGVVVGASKLVRLVRCFSKRLQLQERLTTQIASAIMEEVKCKGAGVIMRAHHSCMGCRGVEQRTVQMVTSALLGVMREPAVRAEFTALVDESAR